MTKRSGSNQRRLTRTVSSRWDETHYDRLLDLADANGKSIGAMLRWLVNRADAKLPRTKELSRELLQIRIALNGLAQMVETLDRAVADDLRATMREIEIALSKLK